jgi:hypothetical protein
MSRERSNDILVGVSRLPSDGAIDSRKPGAATCAHSGWARPGGRKTCCSTCCSNYPLPLTVGR